MTKPHCLCRHAEHEGTRCFWESPGGDLVGQYCTCEEYLPCPHPPEKIKQVKDGTYCEDCAQWHPDALPAGALDKYPALHAERAVSEAVADLLEGMGVKEISPSCPDIPQEYLDAAFKHLIYKLRKRLA